MNEAIKNMLTRTSVKKYLPKQAPKELVEQIVEVGLSAPSGKNWQAPVVLVVTDKQVRDEMAKLNAKVMGMGEDFDPFYGAPTVLVVLADKTKPTYVYDGSLVMENMLLAAHSLGLGACWIHRAKEVFDSEAGKVILKKAGLKGDYEGIGNCIVGYADGGNPPVKARAENRVFYI